MLFAPRPFDLSDYLSRLSADVGHAILTVAIVEEWLEALLLQHLQLDEFGVARHFGDYGPLNSFGKKITKAHDLLLIDEDTRRDLDVLKEVRNAFAHTKRYLDFDSGAMARLLGERPKKHSSSTLSVRSTQSTIRSIRSNSTAPRRRNRRKRAPAKGGATGLSAHCAA